MIIIAAILTLTATAFSEEKIKVPVKRVHSRQRRFIAPGALWDMMFGFESIGRDWEFRYDVVIHYRMDYLFGGLSALQGQLAANQAAQTATQDALAAAGKRKKRRLVFLFTFSAWLISLKGDAKMEKRVGALNNFFLLILVIQVKQLLLDLEDHFQPRMMLAIC